MSLLQAVLTGVFVSVALAIISGFIYMVVKERFERSSVPPASAAPQAQTYMEVWRCPHCHRLSRIARQCKWCMKEMPLHPQFLTVPEKQYTEQLLLPGPTVRKNPDDSHLSS